MQSRNPYKPRLVLNVGVIGHRPNRLAAGATEPIQAAITDVLRSVAVKLESLSQQHAEILSKDRPAIRVLSALAEGADRIGAAAALAAGTELHALLPFDAKEYEHDFADNESKEEFQNLLDSAGGVLELSGRREKAEDAYEAVGYELLRRSDLLIAVWDSGPSAGRGGTTSIIDHAIAINVPVVHVDANGQHPPVLICPSDRLLPYVEPGFEEGDHRELSALSGIIEAVMAPPEDETDIAAIRQYLDEREHRWRMRLAYPLLLCATCIRGIRLSDLRIAPYVESTRDDTSDLLTWSSKSTPPDATDNWLSAFAYADRLAVHYAQTFRSGYVFNFVFAAIAVSLALFGIVFPGAKTGLVSIEFVIILSIIWNTQSGNSNDWHHRWLDYRQLAERLRLIPITTSLGTLTSPRVSRATADHDRSPTWVAWYAQRVAREFPIPNDKFDDAWIGALKAELRSLLSDQIKYHSGNSKNLESLEHRLHLLGLVAFSVTAVICFAYIVAKFFRPGSTQMARLRMHECRDLGGGSDGFVTNDWSREFGHPGAGRL